MTRLLRAMLAAAVSATLLSSCTTLNANSLPQPGDNYRDGYDVIVEFSNVLNLPERAKVVMDGTPVGVVTKVKHQQLRCRRDGAHRSRCRGAVECARNSAAGHRPR